MQMAKSIIRLTKQQQPQKLQICEVTRDTLFSQQRRSFHTLLIISLMVSLLACTVRTSLTKL